MQMEADSLKNNVYRYCISLEAVLVSL